MERERIISAAVLEIDQGASTDGDYPTLTALVDLALADDPEPPFSDDCEGCCANPAVCTRDSCRESPLHTAWRNREALHTIIREKGLSE